MALFAVIGLGSFGATVATQLISLKHDILHVAIFSKDKILDDDRSRYHSIDIKVAHEVLTTTLNSLKKSLIKFIVYK